jgi:hypothetical protein
MQQYNFMKLIYVIKEYPNTNSHEKVKAFSRIKKNNLSAIKTAYLKIYGYQLKHVKDP